MKKIFTLVGLLVAGILILLLAKGGGSRIMKEDKLDQPRFDRDQKDVQKKTSNMKITSSAFSHNETIPSKYTCDGENVSPPLEFVDVPVSAKSLVLIVDDPDAPSKTWVHWVVYNIDPAVRIVEEGSVPKEGVLGMTDFGRPGYGGPCPPSGEHRYFFKLFALHSRLNLPQNADKNQVEDAMKNHILETAELIGLYSRK